MKRSFPEKNSFGLKAIMNHELTSVVTQQWPSIHSWYDRKSKT